MTHERSGSVRWQVRLALGIVALLSVTAGALYWADTTRGDVSGELRHLDEADAAIEAAAGNTHGILDVADDGDDAIGSFHQVCIENTPLTHAADQADITWYIEPAGSLSRATVHSVVEVAGPSGEPCVRWGSGGPDGQHIRAVWDNGVANPVHFVFSVGGAVAAKAWNEIESAAIVRLDGDVGDTVLQHTREVADWLSRPELHKKKPNVAGTVLKLNQGKLDYAGPSFGGYVTGSHEGDPRNFYGALDGVQQTFTVGGSCGSVRLEDPTTGVTHILLPGDSVTLLSSDKGVAFQVVPNDNGSLVTTRANSDCHGKSHETTVAFASEEDNLFHAPPLATAPTQTIAIRWVGHHR